MGRKTYDSIFQSIGSGLPERDNLILTKQKQYKNVEQNVHFFNNTDEVFLWLEFKKYNNLFVAGGTSIYKKFLPIANKIEVTHINHNFEGDTFFPEWDKKNWQGTKDEVKKDTKSGLEYYFSTYNRI
jgi:dihydrofolate reductase